MADTDDPAGAAAAKNAAAAAAAAKDAAADLADKLQQRATRVDWFLEMLVMGANQRTFSFGVTLFVGGTIVTGILVSGEDFFDGFAQSFSAALSDPKMAAAAKSTFQNLGKMYAPGTDFTSKPIAYVHLKEARIFIPGQAPVPAAGMWWRGLITRVPELHRGDRDLEVLELRHRRRHDLRRTMISLARSSAVKDILNRSTHKPPREDGEEEESCEPEEGRE